MNWSTVGKDNGRVKFWTYYDKQFMKLYAVARKGLCIPAASMPSERVSIRLKVRQKWHLYAFSELAAVSAQQYEVLRLIPWNFTTQQVIGSGAWW